MNDLGIAHLAANKQEYEPMRDNIFEFIVNFDSELIKSGTSRDVSSISINGSTAAINPTRAQETLRFSVNKASIPNYTQSVIEIKRGNTVMKAAGTMTFDNGSIEVIDYIGADSLGVLKAWQKQAGDPETEVVGRMADWYDDQGNFHSGYKKQAWLIEYTPDFQQVRYWDIQGAWVSGIDIPQKDHEGGDNKTTVTATIVFDKAILRDPDFE